MKNKSIWESNNPIQKENKNFKSLTTDILIIGGGLTGLTTAYFLKDTNKKITIIDKSNIGRGVTCKSTAKINYLQENIYSKLKTMHNEEIAKKYYESQKEAIEIITKIIKDNNIECDLEKVPSAIFTIKNSGINKIEKEEKLLNSWNVTTKKFQKNKKIKAGFSVEDTYIFHPLKYLNGLKKVLKDKVDIYEDVIAKNITKENNKYIVETNKEKITTNIVVVACHYPFFIFPNLFPIKTYIERDYVNSAKVDNPKKFTAINVDKQTHSVRYYKNNIIYVSNNHKLTNKIDYKKNYEKSREDFKTYFKKEPLYTWMNQDIMSNDSLPFIGKLKDNIYISSAYNTWGMTNSAIGAKLVADQIQGKNNKYESLFNPKRINLPLVINSFLGAFNYLKSYIEGTFHKSNPKYVKIKGILYGIYTDELGLEHKVKLICPHMKCPLVFNQEEKTWDCPCHGSRFDIDGNIIFGPSKEEINEKECNCKHSDKI